jgi:hypothetical protein
MKSPVQESLHSHTPENNPNPIERICQRVRIVEDSRSSKRESEEFEGYVFDSELLREGSD